MLSLVTFQKKNPVFNNCKDKVAPQWHDFENVELTSYDNNTDSDEGVVMKRILLKALPKLW